MSCVCADGADGVSGAQAWRNLAGFFDACGRLGGGKVWPVALAVGVSGRAPRLCIHRAAGSKCCAGGVLTAAALGRNWLFHWLGTELGTLRSWQLRCVWMYRHSAGDNDAFHFVCAAMARVVLLAVHFAWDFLFYGLA